MESAELNLETVTETDNILLETEGLDTSYVLLKKIIPNETIKNYIKNASVQDIIEAKQKRFVISSNKIDILGFIDLFEYNLVKREAFIGIVVLDKYRNLGVGYDSIQLLELYCVNHVEIDKLCASIEINNIKSIKLFNKSGFVKKHNDLYEKNIE